MSSAVGKRELQPQAVLPGVGQAAALSNLPACLAPLWLTLLYLAGRKGLCISYTGIVAPGFHPTTCLLASCFPEIWYESYSEF